MDTRNSALVVGLYVAGVLIVVAVGVSYFRYAHSKAGPSLAFDVDAERPDVPAHKRLLTSKYAATASKTAQALRELQLSLASMRDNLDKSTAALNQKSAECKALKVELEQSFELLLNLLDDDPGTPASTTESTKGARTKLESDLTHLQHSLGESEVLDTQRERQFAKLEVELLHADLEIAALQEESKRELAALTFEKKNLEESTIKVIARCGVTAVPWLLELLSDERVEIRRWATKAIGVIGPEAQEAIPYLQELLRDPDEVVRTQSQRALTAIAQPRTE